MQLERRVGLRVGVRRHPLLVAVAGHLLVPDVPGHVLRAHRPVPGRSGRDGPHRAQHLHLLVAHGVGVERRRRLHGDEREQLDEVRRDHVAQRAGLLVVRAAVLDAQRLRGGDLHEVHVAPVPDRLEDAVGEAQHQQVLHRLLGQVVVDAVDLPLVEHLPDDAVQLVRRLQVAAERLLDDQARPAGARAVAARVLAVEGAAPRQARGAQLLDDHLELAGRGREVEHTVAARPRVVQLRPGPRRAACSPRGRRTGRGCTAGTAGCARTSTRPRPPRRSSRRWLCA